jgi:hypothetical protein
MVGTTCTVKGCHNRTVNKTRGVHFFQFPNDAVLAQTWVERCQMNIASTNPAIKSRKVCSEHFVQEDFDTLFNGKLMLKEGAAPSRNLPGF